MEHLVAEWRQESLETPRPVNLVVKLTSWIQSWKLRHPELQMHLQVNREVLLAKSKF
jgi:hypothetical protein